MFFLEHQENNPEFLNNFLKYAAYISFRSNTTVTEMFTDLRTFFRYLILINKDEKSINNISIEEFRKINIQNITLDEIKEVHEKDIDNYLFFLKDVLKNTAKTRNRKLATLKYFFKYLDVNNLITGNPTRNCIFAKLEKRNPKYLNLQQSKELLSNILNSNQENNIRNYTIACLFLNTCIRLSELSNINISDINTNENNVKIRGKGNKERIIYLNEAVIEAINEYLKIRPILPTNNLDYDALFISKQHKRLSRRAIQDVITTNLKITFEENGTKFHTHSLRHSGATLMYTENNTDILIIKEILGHNSLSSTQIYTHVPDERMKYVMNHCTISSILNIEEEINCESK